MKIRKILTMGLAFLITVCVSVSFVGCGELDINDKESVFIYGDFRYCYVDKVGAKNSVKKDKAIGVNVLNFVEVEKKWERVIIPETIDGLPVIDIGMVGLGWRRTLEGYFDKIYLPVTLQDAAPYNIFWDLTIFLIDKQDDELMENRKILINRRLDSTSGATFVIFESMYDWYQEFFVSKSSSLVIANLTYIVDGVEYWMDDCKDGQYVQIPPTPKKEGFIFDGWYLENEYINKWNFSTNTYKKPQDSVSLKLYAKFV